MSITPANRLNHLKEYYFSSKLRELKAMEEEGKPIINLGIGSPDSPPDQSVVDKLNESAAQNNTHGYQPYQGIKELKSAITDFYKNQYGVSIADQSILPLMGSKEGVTHLSLAYLNPKDQVLIPSLAYPTYAAVSKMVEAEPVYYHLNEDQNWEPDWHYLEELDTSRVKMMWINYPHMPTGTRGSKELFKRFVAYAEERDILLCHDNPYSLILNPEPLSIFSVKGADKVAVELNSLSKTFNMAGWRVGYMIGRDEIIQPVLQVKSNMDSGMFRPVQEAAIAALHLGAEWYSKLNAEYESRREIVYKILKELNCEFTLNQSGLFVWAKVPDGSAKTFTDNLLYEKYIFVTPGFIFGSGEQYIRISLCSEKSVLEEVLTRIAN